MLKTLRTRKGITLSFVAEKLNISRDRLRRIENGKSSLPVEFVPVLSNLYGVDTKEILERRVEECQIQKKN